MGCVGIVGRLLRPKVRSSRDSLGLKLRKNFLEYSTFVGQDHTIIPPFKYKLVKTIIKDTEFISYLTLKMIRKEQYDGWLSHSLNFPLS